MTVAVDTLKIYNRLRNANLNELAAREIAEVFRELTETHLATKADVEKAKAALQADVEKVKLTLQAEIENVKVEMRTEIEKVTAEMRTEIEKAKVAIIKWVAGMLVAQAAIVATLVKIL